MTELRRQSLTAYGAPLCEAIADCPVPTGTEVLVRITRCGVCHSDLHIQDGYFKLAGDKKLDITAGRPLPLTLGHEIAGVVDRAGADAAVTLGKRSRSIRGSAAAPAPPAGTARRTCARRRAISASMSTAASPPMCWYRIRAISSTTRRCGPRLPPC